MNKTLYKIKKLRGETFDPLTEHVYERHIAAEEIASEIALKVMDQQVPWSSDGDFNMLILAQLLREFESYLDLERDLYEQRTRDDQ